LIMASWGANIQFSGVDCQYILWMLVET
jgi:hypothetical protein